MLYVFKFHYDYMIWAHLEYLSFAGTIKSAAV